jgi:hypothetical protein
MQNVIDADPSGLTIYTAIKCRETCPKLPIPPGQRDPIIKLWSNPSNWPNNTLPKAG